MSFTVREPEARETPVVVEAPHAGLSVDAVALATLVAPARSLAADADLYVHDLYADAPAEGATLIFSHVSRYVCDLNRSEQDVDSLAAEGGVGRSAPHGLVWRTTTEDAPALARPIPRSELERRLNEIYRPYHRTLRELLERKRQQFGYAILLCAHSMPSRGRSGHSDPGCDRADIVPGSRGRTTAAGPVIDTPEEVARGFQWTVTHDSPYRGGFSTGHYGRPESHIHAVQVEIARRLYMDERSLTKNASDFERTRAFCRTLVARLGTLTLR